MNDRLKYPRISWGYFFCTLVIAFLASCSEPKQETAGLNYSVHTFYYNWYGNPSFDNEYRHWAHDILPHWADTSSDNLKGFGGADDIGANYFPQLGCYSCNDSNTVRQHMAWIAEAGIGVVTLSWWGRGSFEDKNVELIMNEASKKKIKVNFHVEPFNDRSAQTTKLAINYIVKKYGSHPAFHRIKGKGVFYIYDSYLIRSKEWAKVFPMKNVFAIGLWVDEAHGDSILASGFDGAYTYFASDGFTYGSTKENWKGMSEWGKENNKLFVPCAGPGYLDTRIRPWNDGNTKNRKEGVYYDLLFAKAIESKANVIGITSFNEWHEGTQIEPASPFHIDNYVYQDYSPREEDYYLKRTKYWTTLFQETTVAQ